MERYAPDAKDLAPRDVVARAMSLEVAQGEFEQNVYYFDRYKKCIVDGKVLHIYMCP